MILVNEYSTADNGTIVQSAVDLGIEDIGHVDRPFWVLVRVDNVRLFDAHVATEAEAKAKRSEMHASYLEAHAS